MPIECPLLTIAIPTYNRADYLQELLSNLMEQLVQRPEIELLISDNASTDETTSVVLGLLKENPGVRYIRNPTNIGADANFLQCFEMATGKYFWLVGDDDIVAPGGIAKILSLIADHEYALIHLCPYPFRPGVSSNRDRDRFGRFAQCIPNGPSFIRLVGPMITFISSMIVNKQQFRTLRTPELASLVGTNLIQLGWTLPLLASVGESLIVWDKILAARVGNSGGYGICRVFSKNLSEVILKTIPTRLDIGRILVNISLRDWFPTTIIQIRSSLLGNMHDEDFSTLLEELHRRNWRYWVFTYPIVALPRWAARVWWHGTNIANRGARLLRFLLGYPLQRRRMIQPVELQVAFQRTPIHD